MREARFAIAEPHPDIENGVRRTPLEVFVTFPAAGIDADTGVVLVVEAERQRWEVPFRATERLDRAGADLLGIVFNNRKYHIPGWIYERI